MFDEEGRGTPAVLGDSVVLSDRKQGFVWLHIDLVDQRAHGWCKQQSALSDAARSAFLSVESHLRLDHHDGQCWGVVADLAQELGSATHAFADLRFILGSRWLITGRRHHLHGASLVREKIDQGYEISSPHALLESIVASFAEEMGRIVETLGEEINAIEERVIGHTDCDESLRLGAIRRRCLRFNGRLSRLLAALRNFTEQSIESKAPETILAIAKRLLRRIEALHQDLDTTQGRARPERCGRVALILQGGGALGAYQAGVYQALHEAGVEPDWITGVSIGAINAAIIAGNSRQNRIAKLQEFWTRITSRKIWSYTPDGDIYRRMRNATSAFLTMNDGQPGFFKPHPVNAWFSPAGALTATSFYDNSPLRETLIDLVDFSLINSRLARYSVGAVNVLTGNFVYFDNRDTEITPEHIMASGALPPALPMVKIGTDYFWDGGIVSNTPLQHLLEQEDGVNSLVFQVDLFSARGMLPREMADVLGRHKDIMYSSRTRYNTDVFRKLQKWKRRTHAALSRVPGEQLSDDERRWLGELAALPDITILHLIYQQKAYEGHAKDYEFSGTSMREHWQSGHEDTARTLKQRQWLDLPEPGGGILVHDVHRMAEGLS